jgi:hypothetical protein
MLGEQDLRESELQQLDVEREWRKEKLESVKNEDQSGSGPEETPSSKDAGVKSSVEIDTPSDGSKMDVDED